jgi:hypothetical protein
MQELSAAQVAAEGSPAMRRGTEREQQSADKNGSAIVNQRTVLNLVGVADTASGESRRNENIFLNPIDNNALKELNLRLGTTATVIEFFRPERNYFAAEFGNSPSSPLHIASLSARRVHGNVFFRHFNSVVKARSFFQVGRVQPARENEYGGAFGTPTWKGAWLSLEGTQQKIRGNVNGNVLVPTATERVPLTADPRIRPIIERFLAAYPAELPNRPDVNPRALNTNAPQRINTDMAGGGLEQRIRSRDILKAGYNLTSQSVDAFQLVAGQNPDTRTHAHQTRLTWTRAWSAATTTDFSVGFDRVYSRLSPEPNAVGPAVSFGSVIESLGPGSDFPVDRAQNLFRYSGQSVSIRGRHTVTAGFELVRRQINGSEASSHNGVLSFRNDFGRDALTNFRLGIPSRFSGAIGNVHRGFRNWETHLYAGDEWRPGASLTLTLGIRLQPVTGPVEVNDLTEIPYGCDCNNVAPRFGFAYRLPREWGVLRGAYGLHYGQILPVAFQQLRYNPPQNVKFELQAPELASVLLSLTPLVVPAAARSTIYELSPDLATPYSHQYNLAWEPAVFGRLRIQLAWVGSRTHQILTTWHLNRARPVSGIEQVTSTINLRRPDQRFFDVRRILNGSSAYYDAARAMIVLPRWRDLTLEASYWFSKALDRGGSYSSTGADESRSQSEFLFQEDLRGVSSFHQPHALLVRASWSPPKMWAHQPVANALFAQWIATVVFLAKSGTPFTVLSGSDSPGYGNVDGSSGDRPHVVDPAVLGRTIGDPDTSASRLPAGAFAFMNPYEVRGNLGSNTFRKGNIRNLNAAISKRWETAGTTTVTFRAESINLLNTPQFAEPGRELTSPNFGQITNTLNDGRMFRFVLQLGF